MLYLLFGSKHCSINSLCNFFPGTKTLAIGMHLILLFSSFFFFIIQLYFESISVDGRICTSLTVCSLLFPTLPLCCTAMYTWVWHVSCLRIETHSEKVAKWQVRIQKDMQIDTLYKYLCIFSTIFPLTACIKPHSSIPLLYWLASEWSLFSFLIGVNIHWLFGNITNI